jgi:hypothetical protein
MLDAHNFESRINIRHPHEVARRVLAILAILDRTYTTEASPALEWVYAYAVERCFSEPEKEFYFSDNVSDEDRASFGWLGESLAVLLWAMGYLDQLPALNQRFDLATMPYLDNITSSTAQFLVDACLRHPDALLIAEEQYYQAHWRVMNAESANAPISEEINPDIIYERRYAFSWLVGLGDS